MNGKRRLIIEVSVPMTIEMNANDPFEGCYALELTLRDFLGSTRPPIKVGQAKLLSSIDITEEMGVR